MKDGVSIETSVSSGGSGFRSTVLSIRGTPEGVDNALSLRNPRTGISQ